MNLKQCYTILGLKNDATLEMLKKNYRQLAFKFHPDLNQKDPQAAQKFQQVNEAYIILQKELAEGVSKKFTAKKQPKSTARPQTTTAQYTQYREKKAQPEPKECKPKQPFQEKRQTARPQPERKINREKVQKERHEKFQTARQEKIFRALLKDPFAKKVYEDIFLKLKNEKHAPSDHSVRPAAQGSEAKKLSGILSSARTWLHKRADLWETVYVAAQKLIPGGTIQITVQHPFTGSPVCLDIRLPYDFSVGRTLRLRKKGKNLGLFKGDLYLRFLPK